MKLSAVFTKVAKRNELKGTHVILPNSPKKIIAVATRSQGVLCPGLFFPTKRKNYRKLFGSFFDPS